jgi:hypothetical protein
VKLYAHHCMIIQSSGHRRLEIDCRNARHDGE